MVSESIDFRVVAHPFTGEPQKCVNPLRSEHVAAGRLLWYQGFTSRFQWSCPAVIARVDHDRREFYVRSLDDFAVHQQAYSFDVHDGSPPSRQTMRLVSEELVAEYLADRGKKLTDI